MELGVLAGTGERWRLRNPGHGLSNILLSGQTGSGKSTCLNRIVSRASERSDTAIIGADLKGGAELGPWRPRMTRVVTTMEEAADEFEIVHHTIQHRGQLLEHIGELEHSSRRLWQPRMGPWIFVVTDEMAELVPQAGRRGGQRALTEAASIAALGRAVGVFFIGATQYALTSDFPNRLLTNLVTRICHRMANQGQYRVALNVTQAEMETAGWRPITIDEKGAAYVTGVPGVPDLSMVKATLIEDDDVVKIAESTYDLRWPESKVYHVPPAEWVVENYRVKETA